MAYQRGRGGGVYVEDRGGAGVVGEVRVIAGNLYAVVRAGSGVVTADHRWSCVGVADIKYVEALAVVGDVEIFARGVERGWPSSAGIGAQLRRARRVADVYYIYLALPLVGDVEVFAADREPVGLAAGDADRACKSGRGRVADVNDIETGRGVADIGVLARHGDCFCAAERIGADDGWIFWRADVDDAQSNGVLGGIRVAAGNGGCVGVACGRDCGGESRRA